MLYDLFHSVCSLIIKWLNIRIPWTGNIHPTIAQVLVFTAVGALIIHFVRGMLE